jgi:hypothetical protein
MQERFRLLVALALWSCLLYGACLYEHWKRSYTPGVTPDNFRRLHEDMTRDEVQAILGCPGKFQFRMTGSHGEGWHGEECSINLWFSDFVRVGVESGEMTTKHGSNVKVADNPADHNIFAVVRRVLGR